MFDFLKTDKTKELEKELKRREETIDALRNYVIDLEERIGRIRSLASTNDVRNSRR